jgi:CheY-like chemotaxis protein
MDGRTAAKEVRKLEANLEPRDHVSSLRIDGRIPIFAVSASLYESDRQNLARDFDGWLLKPLGEFAMVPVVVWWRKLIVRVRAFRLCSCQGVTRGAAGSAEAIG